MSPNGSIVTLIQNMGGANDNFIGTCMGMDGTAFTNLVAPYSGLVVPVGNLASLNNGQNPNGTWKFIVTDLANADTGSIHEMSIEFTNNPPGEAAWADQQVLRFVQHVFVRAELRIAIYCRI